MTEATCEKTLPRRCKATIRIIRTTLILEIYDRLENSSERTGKPGFGARRNKQRTRASQSGNCEGRACTPQTSGCGLFHQPRFLLSRNRGRRKRDLAQAAAKTAAEHGASWKRRQDRDARARFHRLGRRPPIALQTLEAEMRRRRFGQGWRNHHPGRPSSAPGGNPQEGGVFTDKIKGRSEASETNSLCLRSCYRFHGGIKRGRWQRTVCRRLCLFRQTRTSNKTN